jgi:hypothetical protein
MCRWRVDDGCASDARGAAGFAKIVGAKNVSIDTVAAPPVDTTASPRGAVEIAAIGPPPIAKLPFALGTTWGRPLVAAYKLFGVNRAATAGVRSLSGFAVEVGSPCPVALAVVAARRPPASTAPITAFCVLDFVGSATALPASIASSLSCFPSEFEVRSWKSRSTIDSGSTWGAGPHFASGRSDIG